MQQAKRNRLISLSLSCDFLRSTLQVIDFHTALFCRGRKTEGGSNWLQQNCRHPRLFLKTPLKQWVSRILTVFPPNSTQNLVTFHGHFGEV
jgi:hypothetical protein